MIERIARTGSLSRKLLLFAAGSMAFAVPVMIGALHVPVVLAQATTPSASPAHAPGDIAGDWQGTLQARTSLRVILRIARTDKGWTAKMYSIDQGGQPINVSSVILNGTAFKISVDQIGGSYQGTLSADGNSMVGSWTQGPTPQPLTLVRATKETAWEIPAPPPPQKPMAADADPSFEVATIKPNDPDKPGLYVTVNGRNFRTHNYSLAGLIEFAYGVHAKQIVNGPEWIDKDTYDIAATPDGEGQPNDRQWKGMVQKLLAERFKLTFHHDKRELSVFTLTVGKDGPKNLTKSESTSLLPGLFFGPTPGGIMLPARNATMADFAGVMQAAVLDRPVVDQTGLVGRFDFVLKWEPDDSQFGGHAPPPSVSNEAPPSLFTAIQQQIGLKLDAVKAPVDVIVIDHAEKPSAN